jgi:hypothetical protein
VELDAVLLPDPPITVGAETDAEPVFPALAPADGFTLVLLT